MAQMFNVISTGIPVIARRKLGCPRRVGRCPENVFHLVSVGQRMQEGSGCRVHRRSRRVARGCRARVPGRFVRGPPGVAQCLPALTTSRERPCGVNRVARPRVCRVRCLEDLQDFLRALSGIPGDLTKVPHAQTDLAAFVRHGLPSSPATLEPLKLHGFGPAGSVMAATRSIMRRCLRHHAHWLGRAAGSR